jgi:hypothetical protein
VNIVIFGYNDTEKAQIIDQLEEYFAYTKQDVVIDISNEVDKLAVLFKSVENTDFTESDRIAFAHLYLATLHFYQLPQFEHMFFKTTSFTIDALYDQVFEDLGLDDAWSDVVSLPIAVNEAAEYVRATVEGINSDDSDTPGTEDRTVVRKDS